MTATGNTITITTPISNYPLLTTHDLLFVVTFVVCLCLLLFVVVAVRGVDVVVVIC